MQHYTDFGAEARKRMLQQGITMQEIAKQLNVSTPYVSDIFKGARKGEKQKPLIAKMLGMELEVEGNEQTHP